MAHELDTQNFEHYDEELAAVSGGRTSRIADPHFIGYTFKNWEVTAPQNQAGQRREDGAEKGLRQAASVVA